jgi:hypothetical protein
MASKAYIDKDPATLQKVADGFKKLYPGQIRSGVV